MPQLLIPALVVSLTASTALSIAGAAGAFTPDAPEIPEPPIPIDPTLAENARRKARVQANALNRRATILTGTGLDSTEGVSVGQSTVLG